ncbi:MAG: hypothetical protein COX57_08425 [Alphaproteobacteria bacterium CG_4_10_14_0_2_um_filter_63_37]|nr:MAG: hypothetical protein AUJ55_07510 [Proteobacteria bacterium CG1_02_64_396]PJA24475.1 MAG: hypothetical protein COX57_08425 [Alphaproteobacteria bacterium CG_4_10_14_0_2_um_filter_63_37]
MTPSLSKSLLLAAAVAIAPPAWAQDVNLDSAFFARQVLNEGILHVDSGQFFEALDAFATAFESTSNPDIQAKALLQRASVLANFFDQFDQAAQVYQQILRDFGKSEMAEPAAYQLGMLYFDQEQNEQALAAFEQYLRLFPSGEHARSVTFLRDQLTQPATPAPQPTPSPQPQAMGQGFAGSGQAPQGMAPPSGWGNFQSPGFESPSFKRPEWAPQKMQPMGEGTPSRPVSPPPSTTTIRPASPPLSTTTVRPVSPPPSATSTRPVAQAQPRPVVASPPPRRPAMQKLGEAPLIRVRLFTLENSLSIGAKGEVDLLDRLSQSAGQASGNLDITLSGGSIAVNGRSTGQTDLIVQPRSGLLSVQKEGKPTEFRGTMKIMVYKDKLQLLNLVDLETYLLGVVTSESPASWPVETLKAQAVAARTYALYQMEHRDKWTYDVVADTGDQAYYGTRKETARGRQAVEETRGVIILNDGHPILSQFTASSGWHSASPQAIFDSSVTYMTDHPDPYSQSQQMGSWSKRVKKGDFEEGLTSRGVIPRGRHVVRLEPAEIGPSGRWVKTRIVTDEGSPVVVRSYSSVRRAANTYDILYKSVRDEGDAWVFEGGGFGHGVGYSQWGGKAMGDDGKNYDQILSFYYQGVNIQQMW